MASWVATDLAPTDLVAAVTRAAQRWPERVAWRFDPGERLTFAGFHALDSLRLEKAYRHWGHDIGDADTPLEAGLGFACAFDKTAPFIGREALLAQRERAPTKRLVQFRLIDPGPLLFHDEPIVMDGEPIGLLTSGSYGHTLGAAGAIGIARAFAYGGHAGQPLHDPQIAPHAHATFADYKTRRTTTINHFHEKLLLLKDRLNTEAARELAAARHAFLEEFLARFLAEWNGEA